MTHSPLGRHCDTCGVTINWIQDKSASHCYECEEVLEAQLHDRKMREKPRKCRKCAREIYDRYAYCKHCKGSNEEEVIEYEVKY